MGVATYLKAANRHFNSILFSFGIILIFMQIGSSQEIKKASQCFKSRGIPKVSFGCDPASMIKISRAFHGISQIDAASIDGGPGSCVPNEGHEFGNCSFCEGDCIDDSMNLVYDWSTCMGNTSCLRTVMQSYMPACSGGSKFSDYLQVEYQCVPKESVIDICSGIQQRMTEGHITSPNYPEHYPTNVDCLCKIETDWSAKITLSFYDLLLETKQGRCRADWLMLRQQAQKHRHCGAIMTGTKNITSETNSITLQFHTDENDNTTQNFQYFSRKLKGFWLFFKAEHEASMQVTCRRLTENDIEVQEILADDADYTGIITPDEDLSTKDDGMAKTTPMNDNNEIDGKGDTEENKTKDPAKENEVDAQEGDEQSGVSMATVASVSSVLLTAIFSILFTRASLL